MFGQTENEVTSDRDGSFSPQVLPKQRRVMDDTVRRRDRGSSTFALLARHEHPRY